jgi:hypothetical protein
MADDGAYGSWDLGPSSSGILLLKMMLMAHFLCPRLPPHEHAEVEQLLKVRGVVSSMTVVGAGQTLGMDSGGGQE